MFFLFACGPLEQYEQVVTVRLSAHGGTIYGKHNITEQG